MNAELYFCHHCNGVIQSLNTASSHECFRGKEHIYQTEADSNVLFVDNFNLENKENDEDFDNSSLSGCSGYVQSHENLSDAEEFKIDSNAKKDAAVWTKKDTIAMLSLYEANIEMVMEIGKQSHIWKKISNDLKELRIQVTADQVKWKFKRLNSTQKECIDNNSKSGRGHITFVYYNQFEQIFHKEKNVSTLHTLIKFVDT